MLSLTRWLDAELLDGRVILILTFYGNNWYQIMHHLLRQLNRSNVSIFGKVLLNKKIMFIVL